MRIHAEMEAEDLLARGVVELDARRLARAQLGKPQVAIEKVRDQEFITRAEGWYSDIALGLRALGKNPVFSLTAIVTLALGIGANTAIFSLLYGLVLRSLPTRAPWEVVQVGIASQAGNSDGDDMALTNGMLAFLRRNLTSFRGVSGWCELDSLMEDEQGSLRMYATALVTGNAFEVIPLRPFMGRLIAPYDDLRGGPTQGWPVVLSYGFWSNHYGKDAGIIGKQIRVSGTTVTVVGIMPPEFKGVWPGTDVKLYMPMQFANILLKEDVLNKPDSFFGFSAIGRLQQGVSVEKANAEVSRFQSVLLNQFIPKKFQHGPYFEQAYTRVASARGGLPSYALHTFAKPLYLMQGLVGLVLLLCCANVGGLMMSSVYRRQREFAVRTALGANVSRLVRQYLTESLLLAVAGGALGTLFAWRGCGVLLHFFRDPMMGEAMEVSPDRSTLLFAGGLAVVTTLVFGVLPAWRAGHADPGHLLKSRTSLGGQRHIAGRTFIPVQVAFSLVLVVLASLLSQSVLKLRSEHTGFDTDHVTIQTSRISVLKLNAEARLNLYQSMVDRLQEMPDIRSAAVTFKTPMTGEEVMSRFQPRNHRSRPNQEFQFAFNDVGPGYFQTMQTRIVAGREFAKNERALNVCILNRAAATSLFPGAEALGQYVRSTDEHEFPAGTECRVIGIAEDAKFSDVRQGPPRTIYFPLSLTRMETALGNLVFLINSGTKSAAVLAFRKALAEKAPTVPLVTFVTLREQMDAAIGSEELITLLSNFFGVVAVLLSALGLYGLLSATVVQRTGEIGMRVALGADPRQVVRLIMRDALAMVAVGLAAGGFALVFVGRLVTAMLHGVSAFDPLTIISVALTLIAVSLVAALLPALRAATIDPIQALRFEL
jgi:predicted permease